MSELDVRMVVLSTDDLDESIRILRGPRDDIGSSDGAHFAALDGGSGHHCPGDCGRPPHSGHRCRRHQGQTMSTMRLRRPSRPTAVRSSRGPYDDAHERRAVVHDHQGRQLASTALLG